MFPILCSAIFADCTISLKSESGVLNSLEHSRAALTQGDVEVVSLVKAGEIG